MKNSRTGIVPRSALLITLITLLPGISLGLTDLIILREVGSCSPGIRAVDVGNNAGPGLDWGLKPDGSEMIFFTGSEYSNGGDLWEVDPTTGAASILFQDGRAWQDVACAPDGMQLYLKDNTDYPDAQSYLYSLELTGLLNRSTTWTNNRNGDLSFFHMVTEVYPVWGAPSDIVVATRFGALRQVVCGFSGREAWAPTFDPVSEDHLYYSLDPDRYGSEWGRIMRMPLDGSDCPGTLIYMPAVHEDLGGLSIAPDGSRLAFVRSPFTGGPRELVVAELDPVTREITSLCVPITEADNQWTLYAWTAFSPDSSDLVILGEPNGFSAVHDDEVPPADAMSIGIAPNPFNPATTISFTVPVAGHGHLAVFNLRGEMVRVLAEGEMAEGPNQVVWNGLDQHGNRVASGPYIIRLETNAGVRTGKLTVLK